MGFGDILGGIGDIAGFFAGSGDRQQATDYLNAIANGYGRLNPTINGNTVNGSAYTQADPATRAAQMQALAQLQSAYGQGGLSAMDRARLAEIEQSTANNARAGQAAAFGDAARRGLANSATALVSQQQAGQDAAQLGGQQGIQAAGLAQQSRLDEIGQAGQLAGQVRGQDYQSAAAQDAIARFNAAQRQQADEQTFQNSLARQGGIAGANQMLYGQSMGDAQRLQNLYGGAGRAIGGVADYFGDYPGGGRDTASVV